MFEQYVFASAEVCLALADAMDGDLAIDSDGERILVAVGFLFPPCSSD